MNDVASLLLHESKTALDCKTCFIHNRTPTAMSANRIRIRPSLRFILLAFLGISITGSSSARIWTKKDGTKLEANFVKYDTASKILTVNAGGKEQKISAVDLISEDQERLSNRKHADAVPASPEVAKDEIFSLLGKSTADVTGALKTLKLVEDLESMKTPLSPPLPHSEISLNIQHRTLNIEHQSEE